MATIRAPRWDGLDQIVRAIISIWDLIFGMTSGVLATMQRLPTLSSASNINNQYLLLVLNMKYYLDNFINKHKGINVEFFSYPSDLINFKSEILNFHVTIPALDNSSALFKDLIFKKKQMFGKYFFIRTITYHTWSKNHCFMNI